MRKKLLSLALALALCLGLTVPASAAAASATVVKTLEDYTEYTPGYDAFYTVYSEGLLAVDEGGKWTFFDINGNTLTDEYYQTAKDFSEGLAAVQQAEGWGYIDKTGKMVIAPQPQYDFVNNFHDGVARVRNGETKKYGIIDKSGNVVVPAEYRNNNGGPYIHEASEGLILAYDEPNGYWGYFDTKGNVAIPFQYRYANDFEGGYAKVGLDRKDTFIDKTGRDIIPDQYESPQQLTVDGEPTALFSVYDTTSTDDNHLYLLNGSGQVIAGPYSDIGKGGGTAFSSGLLPVFKYDGKTLLCGYINTAGQEVIPCGQFRDISDFVDGYALVSASDGNQVIINTAGQITATLSQDPDVRYSSKLSEGCLAVSSAASGKSRYGFINASGQQIADYKYQNVRDFSSGLAVVTDFAGQKGVINTAGQEVVPCKYDSISDFVNGVAVVTSRFGAGGYLCGLINSAGQEILPCIYNQNDMDGMLSDIQEAMYSGDGDKDVLVALNTFGKNSFTYYLIRITPEYAVPTATTPVTPAAPTQPSGPSANPTNSKVLVNGKEVAFDAYTIEGSNYFKLRDLAFVLNGTEKQFEVGWDNASKTITLTSGSAYTANGSEMAKGSGAQSAAVSASKLLIDGKEVSLTAYTIGGNNYFKLRDIGQAFDFGIGWDNASKTITIDTSTGYTA